LRTRFAAVTEVQFIPYLASYIRGRRWEDEPDPKSKKVNSNSAPLLPPTADEYWDKQS
jgi:hypothetical protein